MEKDFKTFVENRVVEYKLEKGKFCDWEDFKIILKNFRYITKLRNTGMLFSDIYHHFKKYYDIKCNLQVFINTYNSIDRAEYVLTLFGLMVGILIFINIIFK